jgi:hypothetical protein
LDQGQTNADQQKLVEVKVEKAAMEANGGGGKKKGLPLAPIIDAGMVRDGEVLRYITVRGSTSVGQSYVEHVKV